MTGIRFLNPGFATTVQDFGRIGFQKLGVPVSGVLDPVSMRLANALVGNEAGEAVLEVRLMGPMIEAVGGPVRLAVTGTGTPVEIVGDETVQVPANQSVLLAEGQKLRLGALADSATACIAVSGGMDIKLLYGSRSTFLRGGFGGVDGRTLAEGDLIPLRREKPVGDGELKLPNSRYLERREIVRVVTGPQDDCFTEQSLAVLFESDYEISREADRMGMRLIGPDLTHARGHDIISDGIVTGAIQVPGNGKPIILLADHQTTGGYPKVGTVVSADLPGLGRARPGEKIRFEHVSVGEAEDARRNLEKDIERIITSLAPAGAWLDEAALLRENLVSGVVGPDGNQ